MRVLSVAVHYPSFSWHCRGITGRCVSSVTLCDFYPGIWCLVVCKASSRAGFVFMIVTINICTGKGCISLVLISTGALGWWCHQCLFLNIINVVTNLYGGTLLSNGAEQSNDVQAV